MRNKTSLKLKEKSSKKTGLAVALVTAVFATLGVVFLIIGYHDQVLHWMFTTGIAFLVVSLLPLGVFLYNVLQRKIDS